MEYLIPILAALAGSSITYIAMRMVERNARARGRVEGELEHVEKSQQQIEDLQKPLDLDPAKYGSRWRLMRESREKK